MGAREIGPGDPRPRGRYVVVGSDGTRREVFGGPAFRPCLTGREWVGLVWSWSWRWLLLVGVLVGLGFLN